MVVHRPYINGDFCFSLSPLLPSATSATINP